MNHLPIRLKQVAAQIPAGASVLDVGCSNGLLLQYLRDSRAVDGRGIEIDPKRVAEAVARGLSVVQGDADHDLKDFPDNSVDFAVLSEALQAMHRPAEVLDELLRIGRSAIVAFPNFGHWRVRVALGFGGRMPVTRGLPSSWYETDNIHLCTVNDFRSLARERGYRIERQSFLSGETPVSFMPNLRADHALFVLTR